MWALLSEDNQILEIKLYEKFDFLYYLITIFNIFAITSDKYPSPWF